ncbi:hypothetical protein [Roseovarius sp. EL26]|uniref:COG3904 family protein n=1 Tax=Roseovarius sp. EL26 TaxID=2126672 RepID=UPI000EA0FCDC|nr:hypothetical protein [Roseovarius sp. EL26]
MIKVSERCRGFRGIFVVMAWFCLAGEGTAGEWNRTNVVDGTGCILKFEGPVERGDAQELEAALDGFRAQIEEVDPFYYMRDFTSDSVCLNSEGGTFSEGVKIAQFLQLNGLGTVVEAGDRCLSACAIAFMGGSYSSESDRGSQPSRAIYPTARLGFHSPSLNLPKSQYSEAIVSDAYAAALSSIADLQVIADDIRFPRSLLVTMLQTPPEQMMIVETVGQAAQWRLIVAGVEPVKTLQTDQLEHACENIDAGLLDEPARKYGYAFGIGGDPYTLRQEGDNIWFGEYTGFRQELATPCSLTYYTTKSTETLHTSLIQGIVELVEWTDLYAYHLFAPETKLSALPVRGE